MATGGFDECWGRSHGSRIGCWFLTVAGFQLAPLAPENQEPEIHDFVYEDYLDVEDGVVVMQA